MTTTEPITIETADGPMPALQAVPAGPARGGVIVVQEAFGLTPYIGRVCTRLADAGFRAIAPALFHRQGAPVLDYGGDLAAVRPLMAELTQPGIDADVTAALRHLAGTGLVAAEIGVIGFCMGGTIAFTTATRHAIGAAVTFYGGGITEGRFGGPPLLELATGLQAPWLGLYGDQDQGIPVDDVDRLGSAVVGSPVDAQVIRYAQARHGFHCEDRPDAFDAEAAADGWARALVWFDEHLGRTSA